MTEQERQERVDDFLQRNPKVVMNDSDELLTKEHTFKCKQCKWTWSGFPVRIARAKGCAVCGGSSLKAPSDYRFKIQLKKQKLELLTELAKNTDKIMVRCLKCKREWETYRMKMNSKYQDGCSPCKKKEKKAKQQLRLSKILSKREDLKMVSEYKSSNESIDFKCLKCDKVWSAMPYDALRGRVGCGNCKTSKGEDQVKEILDKYNIKYTFQWTNHKCYHNNKLRFDFKVIHPGYSSVIEYHGKQHYEYVEFFHRSEETFEQSQIRDQIKREYCEEKNIPYLEIRYDDLNIEKTILNFFKKEKNKNMKKRLATVK